MRELLRRFAAEPMPLLRSAPPKLTPTLHDLANFEISPYRWYYDALLRQFDAVRTEIGILKGQLERSYTFSLGLLGAAVAGKVIIGDADVKLVVEESPWLLLLIALLTLWFPLNNVLTSIDMALGGAYIRTRLEPRMNALLTKISELSETPPLEPPLDWEEYTRDERYRGSDKLVFLPLYAVRSLVLLTPAGLLVGLYVELEPGRGTPRSGYILLTLLAVFLVLMVLGGVKVWRLNSEDTKSTGRAGTQGGPSTAKTSAG